jgi:hypothetical protein
MEVVSVRGVATWEAVHDQCWGQRCSSVGGVATREAVHDQCWGCDYTRGVGDNGGEATQEVVTMVTGG